MIDVPLFPLGTVLFPQMVLPLYIFEQRYRQMISECVKNNSPFGVILLQEGDEVQETTSSEPAQPCAVGTLARITEVARLDDGRMLITSVGTERFRLMEYRNDKPYMTGDIELWPDDGVDEALLQPQVSQVQAAFQNYLKVLMELAGKQVQGLDVPSEPDVRSYLVPTWLYIGMPEKQKLLELPGPAQRLQAELNILSGETEFFERLREKAILEGSDGPISPDAEESPFGLQRPSYDIASRFSKN